MHVFVQLADNIHGCVGADVADMEATEACSWLRATGFPQYARMYEGGWYMLFYDYHSTCSFISHQSVESV